MKLEIKGAPNKGGALARYLSNNSAEIGWIPDASSTVSKQITAALDGESNDPAAWISYGATALQRVWDAFPADARNAMRDQFSKLVARGLQGVGAISDSIQGALSSSTNAVPIIGAIIEGVIQLVFGFISIAKASEDTKKQTAAARFMDATRYTVERYEHPNSWVLKKSKVTNYLNRKDRDWWIKPSFSRSGGASDLMFTTRAGVGDKGKCGGNGVEVRCGTKTRPYSSDCSKRDKDETYCTRYVMISALFFPFWSTAYPDKDAITEKKIETNQNMTGRGTFEAKKVTANSLLIARQMALLSSPSVNLRVEARRLIRFRDRFEKWFLGQSLQFGQGKVMKVLPVGKNRKVVRGKGTLTIDAAKRSDLPGKNDANQFYLDDDGLIQTYRPDVDRTAWGLVAKRGPQTPDDVAITVAQFNTVLGATLAFMSARANFLRNGPIMKVLLKDFKLKDFDPRVRDAMKYAAETNKMLSAPTATRTLPKRSAKRRADASESGASLGVVAAVAAAGYALLRVLR